MENCGFEVVDISENELAKTHGRYLVGGKSQSTKSSNEKIYQFEFPENQMLCLTFTSIKERLEYQLV